jgi:hypothetical protein
VRPRAAPELEDRRRQWWVADFRGIFLLLSVKEYNQLNIKGITAVESAANNYAEALALRGVSGQQ